MIKNSLRCKVLSGLKISVQLVKVRRSSRHGICKYIIGFAMSCSWLVESGVQGEDTLTHFQWWDRGLNSMEDVSRLLCYSVFFNSIGCRLFHIFCVWTLFLSQIILCGIVVAMQQELCMFFSSVISSFMEKWVAKKSCLYIRFLLDQFLWQDQIIFPQEATFKKVISSPACIFNLSIISLIFLELAEWLHSKLLCCGIYLIS